MLRKRSWHASVYIKGKLYVLCGLVGGRLSRSVDCLTLESGQWESLPDSPITATAPIAAELSGKLFMLAVTTNQLLQFDVENEVWTDLASLPGEIAKEACMIAVNGRLCVAGGPKKICAWYNPATNTWIMGTQKPKRVHCNGSLVQQDNNTLLLLGGRLGLAFRGTDYIEQFNIADGAWSRSKLKMPMKNLHQHKALYLDIPQD